MAGALRALRWRAAVTLVAALLVLAWIFVTGQGPGYLIQIDYSWGGERLDGAEVVIDGEVVGVLKRQVGGQRVTGFRVEAGERQVLVRIPDCGGAPRTVHLSPKGARRAVLMGDVDDAYRCEVILW